MIRPAAAGSYPVGVRALLPDQARRHRVIESGIVSVLEQHGFDEVIVPMIDFIEPYAGALDASLQRSSYRFTDRAGDLLIVRSDFTPMLARAMAPCLDRFAFPFGVYYRGDVVRCEPTRLGPGREFYQIGAELVGDPSADADFAIISLASQVVSRLGIETTLVVSDSTLLPAFIDGCGGSDASRQALWTALASRRAGEIDRIPLPMDERRREILRRLARGVATLEDLAMLPETSAGVQRLRKLIRRAAGLPVTEIVTSLDDVDESPSYYTGMRFRLFDARTRTPLVQGGRYDDLYGRFGASAAAVGFTLTLDYVDAAREAR